MIRRFAYSPGLALLIAFCAATTDAHQFYVSMSKVKWIEGEKRLDVTIRIFTDNLEEAVGNQGGPALKLGTDREHAESDTFIAAYVRSKVEFLVNGRKTNLEFVEKYYALDATACVFQIRDIDEVKMIEVHNNLLTELYDDQTNIVRFEIGDAKKFVNLNKKLPSEKVAF